LLSPALAFDERARIARAPAARVHQREKVGGEAVEEVGLFDVYRVTGRGHDGEPRGAAHALDEESRLEAVRVLVAADDVGGYRHPRETSFQAVDSGTARL